MADEEVPYGSQEFEEDDDQYDGYDDDIEDELEDALRNCGKMADGLCSKAGSEECDWECPFS